MVDNSISITNHSKDTIEIISIQDDSVIDADRQKTYTIHPKDSYVFFLDRVENLQWKKSK